ncbi:hypothetical protein [Streptomyces sp. NPDC052302]|uniref:hypothetical protein n=1 Tax=Streptomyces sp. NPDC052302 TaxID=3365688 RepID=UPI0037CD100E
MAVFVGVVVALTGARHSHGGGCSGSDSHSSSSSSGGYGGGSTHHYDDDDDDYGTGSTSGGTRTGDGPAAAETRDVKIDRCENDPDRGLVARVSATNSDALRTYSYTFTVTFKDSGGRELDKATSGILTVEPGATESVDVVARASATTSGTCVLGEALRMDDSY